ncbi:AEC family transporter [Herbaspirillum lusitanum]|uniref:AEC family transporter n=1 Tax=Herbaspirillum lusitanum TaxID=213312 RepID=A0ABW9A3T2_9BURK
MNALTNIVPVFAIIFGGWLAARTRYVSESVEKGLTEYVFSIAVPALIFNALTRPDVQGELVPSFWAAYFGGAAIAWIVCGLTARYLLRQPRQHAAMLGFSTSQSNTVFVGVPLILHTFGDAGALPLFMLLALHMPLMMGAATFVLEAQNGTSPGDSMKGVARSLFKNPMFLALILGALTRFSGLTFPGMPRDIVGALGATASTCALFALGTSIQRLGLSGQWRSTSLITVGKLLIHPLAVWLLATRVFSMPPVFAGVATLFAAMPVGINSYLIAMRYKANEGSIALGVAISTLISVLTTTMWLAVLEHAGD